MLIEDYALIGDTQTAALVGRNGSIDWLCLPRFDGGACFAKLLGDDSHGHWTIAPDGEAETTRRYVPRTLILETEHVTATGKVRIRDFMPIRSEQHPKVVRLVHGVEGKVAMTMDLVLRFDYGDAVPWVRRTDTGVHGISGPNGVNLHTPAPLDGHHLQTTSHFEVSAGETVPFELSWFVSHQQPPGALDAEGAMQDTIDWWRGWCEGISEVHGPWEDMARAHAQGFAATAAPSYSSRPGSCPDGRV